MRKFPIFKDPEIIAPEHFSQNRILKTEQNQPFSAQRQPIILLIRRTCPPPHQRLRKREQRIASFQFLYFRPVLLS